VIDDAGWLHLTAAAHAILRDHPTPLLTTTAVHDGTPITVRLSLGANHAGIRARITELLGL
jgi:hypothetical protein